MSNESLQTALAEVGRVTLPIGNSAVVVQLKIVDAIWQYRVAWIACERLGTVAPDDPIFSRTEAQAERLNALALLARLDLAIGVYKAIAALEAKRCKLPSHVAELFDAVRCTWQTPYSFWLATVREEQRAQKQHIEDVDSGRAQPFFKRRVLEARSAAARAALVDELVIVPADPTGWEAITALHLVAHHCAKLTPSFRAASIEPYWQAERAAATQLHLGFEADGHRFALATVYSVGGKFLQAGRGRPKRIRRPRIL